MNPVWTATEERRCKSLVAEWISTRPVYDHPEGMDQMVQSLTTELQVTGFDIERIENPDAAHRPLLIARRERSLKKPWVGFFGHYDVEQVDTEAWNTDPWRLTELNGRWYGRGMGDNLLPLAQKVCLFNHLFQDTNVIYLLQGEEEISGPFAHRVYPDLRLPEIALWLEETGYFYRDGRQRLLRLNPDALLTRILRAAHEILAQEGRGYKEHGRTLNKAIGGNQCPCHQHLLNQQPYLAIGPNDDDCAIHDHNESMNPTLLKIPALQLQAISEITAEAWEELS